MPVFPGAPWVPKFGGPESELKYGEWKEQLQGIVQYVGLTEPHKVGILMGALTGVAKRQISVLPEEERNTVAKIFAELDELYKERAPVSVIRTQFYGCRQKPDESVQSFVLRLRELHSRLQQHDPEEAPTNTHLKEQFLLGLEEGPLTQALRRYARQHPEGTFHDLQQEALLLEEDRCGHRWSEVTCTAVGGPTSLRSHPQKDWRAEFKQEIMSELKDQLKGWTQELLQELKPGGSHHQTDYKPRQETGYRRESPATSHMWSADGKPICRRCRQVGHIARFCRERSQTAQPLN